MYNRDENRDRKYAHFVEKILNRSSDEFPYWEEAAEWTIEQAVRRGEYETAVKLELACGRTSIASLKAQEFEKCLGAEAKARIVLAIYKIGETDLARRFQHRWMITRLLPPEFRP